MIDRTVFAAKFGLLLKRFDKQIDDEIIKEYYRLLNPEMSTDEFIKAYERCFFEEDFFPSPQKLVDKVRTDSKVTGLQEWEKIMDAAKRGTVATDLSGNAYKALQAAGGYSAVHYADTRTQLPHIKREFLEAFASIEQSERVTRASMSPEILGVEGRLTGDRVGMDVQTA